MEKYKKGEVKELEEKLPFSEELSAGITVMRIKAGTKLFNITCYADNLFKDEQNRRIIFAGMGNGCLKAVSCVEVFKRSHHYTLHQLTKVAHVRIEEYYDPLDSSLERLKVNRDIPAIYILLSKDPLDSAEPGYQPPDGSFQWDMQAAAGNSSQTQPPPVPSSSGRRQRNRPRRTANEPNLWRRPPKSRQQRDATNNNESAGSSKKKDAS